MPISVVGAGALGCVFGARLAAPDAQRMLFCLNQAPEAASRQQRAMRP